MMKCDAWHEKCACGKMLGGLLWLAGVISLVLGWIAMRGDGLWGYDASFWMMNAVALGILAIPLKLKKKSCGSEMMGCGGKDMGSNKCCSKEGCGGCGTENKA